MSAHDDLVRRIAALVGIADAYRDLTGRIIETSPETMAALLSGLGLSIGDEQQAQACFDRVARLKAGLIPALVSANANRPPRVPLRGTDADAVTWRIWDEDGAVREGRSELTRQGDKIVLELPALQVGYHRLHVEAGGRSGEATAIAAPTRAWQPSASSDGGRLWGTTAQVYSIRSAHDLGIGDYTAVAQAAAGSASFGASFLGLSPVHALFSADRTKISPYSPSSRLFLETIFIDPRAVEGFHGSAAARLLEDPAFAERISSLRNAPLVDHAAVWELKRSLLDALWDDFQRGGEHAVFEQFRRTGGGPLEAHATFEALSEHFPTEGRWWVGDWPAAYRHAGSPEVRSFQESHPDRIAFHVWLQWLADRQLGDAAERARSAGMGIGLYRDLAVGGDRGGSEIWSHPERFALSLSVGAPPDPLGPLGQNWGLPPFDPLVLEQTGLASFRALVTANMRHAGAIRIDHAFQLARLFLIPEGLPASQGAYVAYPFEAMLAVLRLESHRARCLIIAEDLGTGPEGFSDAIMRSGILSYRVFRFEREQDGGFKPPESYPRAALAVVTTHDLPTFRGWWRGLDIDLREALGDYDRDAAERERAARREELLGFAEALAAQDLLPPGEPPEEPPLEASLRYLARTPSSLVGLQLEDASGELNQANLPGPEAGHPNWRRRLGMELDALLAPGGDLAKLAAALAEEGRGARPRANALAAPPPRATYRLQFHKGFTFGDAVRVVPYLARLGISHVYASPIQMARSGSTHGYDIVDHSRINPELGGEEGFERLAQALKEHDLGLVLDIVPNHMGVGGADNPWWLSVLEWGELSPFSRVFDIDWERLGAHHKLIAPFLSGRYGDALEKGALTLAFDPREGSFSIWHWEHRFPISPLTYPVVLDRALAALPEDEAEGQAELQAISERLRAMSEETAPDRRTALPEEGEALKAQLARAVTTNPALAQAIERAVALVNGVAGSPESFGALHRILEAQAYRLAHWRVAASDINYRRFFDINTLAGLRVEDPEIFEHIHATLFGLIRQGLVQGLRIDHIDGLADPAGYVRALQAAIGPGFYIVAEKILEPGEARRAWPIAGTTGYDALNLLDGVFVDTRASDRMDEIYRAGGGLGDRYGDLLRDAKTETLENSFASELEVLVSDVKRLADVDRHTRDYTVSAIRRALVEIIIRFPVYRTYLDDGDPAPEDRALIDKTMERAKRSSALPDRTVHDFIAAALLGDIESNDHGGPDSELTRRFRRRFQQLTGPVMAKSLEDTLFYRYARLLSLNEVGADPSRFGVTPDEFHRANLERARAWPHSMVATATHDTKRGEDARARLSALSEMPDAWEKALQDWNQLTAAHLTPIDGESTPDANDRILILQAILGAWPMELLETTDEKTVVAFRERLEAYALKALREAKRHTSWIHRNEPYENAALALLRGALDPEGSFLSAFRPFAQRLAYLGMLTSLARTVLKGTVPGVPDIYQGTEFWDLSLVDPDNRRPVDFGARMQGLDTDEPPAALLENWRDGHIKQRLLSCLLADRAAAPALYANGDYRVLKVQGDKAHHVLAFMRTWGDERLAILVPRLLHRLTGRTAPPLDPEIWGDTSAILPEGRWRDLFTGAERESTGTGYSVADLFSTLPVAALRAQE